MQIRSDGRLLLNSSEVVDNAEGEALRSEIVRAEDRVPHLVFVFAAGREASDEADICPGSGREDRTGVLLIAAAAREV